MNSLALLVQEAFKRDPHGGDLYVFRGKNGKLIKILWHDGLGMSLYAKHLERGQFIWPSATAPLGSAQTRPGRNWCTSGLCRSASICGYTSLTANQFVPLRIIVRPILPRVNANIFSHYSAVIGILLEQNQRCSRDRSRLQVNMVTRSAEVGLIVPASSNEPNYLDLTMTYLCYWCPKVR